MPKLTRTELNLPGEIWRARTEKLLTPEENIHKEL